MSKCPDAEDAEDTLKTVMQNVGLHVSLNFTYVASYDPLSRPNSTYYLILRYQNTSGDIEFWCKHGPTECLGDKQQLWYSFNSQLLTVIIS